MLTEGKAPGFDTNHKATSTQMMAAIGCIIIFGLNVSYQVVMTSFPYIMENMNITKVEASLLPTVVSLGTIVMALIGTKLIDKITPRWSMLIGTILVTLFLVFNAIGIPYVLWVANGLLAGFGSALGATASVAAIMRQYWGMSSGSKFAVVTGIQTVIVSGYTALMAWLWSFLSFQEAFWVIAAITFIGGVGANLICFSRKPDQWVLDELAASKQSALDKEDTKAQNKEECVGWSFGESFKHSPIYLFTIGFLAIAIINGGLTSFLTTLLVETGMAAGDAALVQSYFILIAGAHILYSGYFQKRFGNKAFFVWFFGLCAVGFVLLAYWANISLGGMVWLLVIALIFVGCMKPILSTAGIVSSDLFGNKDYAAYNAYSQAITNVGRFASSASTAVIMQMFGVTALCYFFAALGVVSAAGFCVADACSPFARKANEMRKARMAKKPADGLCIADTHSSADSEKADCSVKKGE